MDLVSSGPEARGSRLKGQMLLVIVLLLIPVLGAAEEGAKKESACISCHSRLDEKLAAPVKLWEKSYHHEMGNNCEGCHGGDPTDLAESMSPAKGFVGSPKPDRIPAFCGKCHVGVVENYKKSPHYASFQKGTGPSCVTCHNSHDVQRASFDLINESLCSRCHSFENGKKMKKAFITAEMALQDTRSKLERLDHRGMPVKRLEEKLFALRNSLHQLTHTLDVSEIELKTTTVLTDLDEISKEMVPLNERVHKRWVVGALVGAFLITLITVMVKLLRNLEEDE